MESFFHSFINSLIHTCFLKWKFINSRHTPTFTPPHPLYEQFSICTAVHTWYSSNTLVIPMSPLASFHLSVPPIGDTDPVTIPWYILWRSIHPQAMINSICKNIHLWVVNLWHLITNVTTVNNVQLLLILVLSWQVMATCSSGLIRNWLHKLGLKCLGLHFFHCYLLGEKKSICTIKEYNMLL